MHHFSKRSEGPVIYTGPFHGFVRSGQIYLSFSFSRVVGIYGYIWSSIASTYSNAASAVSYNMRLDDSGGLNSSHGPNGRFLGFPVRCLASGDQLPRKCKSGHVTPLLTFTNRGGKMPKWSHGTTLRYKA